MGRAKELLKKSVKQGYEDAKELLTEITLNN